MLRACRNDRKMDKQKSCGEMIKKMPLFSRAAISNIRIGSRFQQGFHWCILFVASFNNSRVTANTDSSGCFRKQGREHLFILRNVMNSNKHGELLKICVVHYLVIY